MTIYKLSRKKHHVDCDAYNGNFKFIIKLCLCAGAMRNSGDAI